VTLNLADTSVVKSRSSVPQGAHLFRVITPQTAVAGVGLLPPFVCMSAYFFARYLKNRCS